MGSRYEDYFIFIADLLIYIHFSKVNIVHSIDIDIGYVGIKGLNG